MFMKKVKSKTVKPARQGVKNMPPKVTKTQRRMSVRKAPK